MTFGPVRVNFSVPRSDPYDHGAKAGWGKWGEESGQETVEKRHQERAGQSGQVCNFFSKAGWCKWGDTCIHKHMSDGQGTVPIPEPQLADSHPGKSREICRFFSKAGWCKHGDTCIHAHVLGDDTTEGRPKEADSGSRVEEGPPDPQEREHTGTSGQVCNFFSKAGWCKYGDGCIHAHILGGKHERLCDLAGELEFSFMTQAGRVWGLGLGSLLPTLRRSPHGCAPVSVQGQWTGLELMRRDD